jgi:hypothetical protein
LIHGFNNLFVILVYSFNHKWKCICAFTFNIRAFRYVSTYNVATLTLGLRPKHRFARGWAKRGTRECERVWEWTFTFPNELPCWELEFQWTPKISKSDCKGQNPSPWGVLYIIEKLLKPRCPKWAHMTHLDICNTSYGQNKGWESTKFPCVQWCATRCWKALDEGYNFGLDPIPIWGLHKKLWDSCPWRFWDSHLGSLETKSHSDATPTGGVEYTIWWKVVASPEFGSWWILWVQGCPWVVLTPKVLQPCANQLVCWFCEGLREWVNCLSLFLVPSRSFSKSLYPSKVLRAKEHASSP